MAIAMRPRELRRHWLFYGLRLLFRLTPMREGTRDRLRQRFVSRFSRLLPTGPRGLAPGVQGEARRRAPQTHAGAPAIGYVPWREDALPAPPPATLVAFYLPQFHPIPENDAWWGAGFTEWRNVGRALPQYEGHAQPRLPGELGYYDLRVPAVMRRQVELAQQYGIGAFCFYFYWFGGQRPLEAPLRQWLADPSLDLPFCLCWANENYSRRWDGRDDEVLLGQRHSPEDDLAFIAHVREYLADPRSLRIDGRPLLLVYRPGLLPDAAATAARWRAWARDNGLGELFLAYVQGFERPDPRDIGFDAAVEFPPNLGTPAPITEYQRLLNPDFRGQVYDWRELVREAERRPMPDYPLFPGVNPSWDNEPRRAGRGRIYAHASPRGYRDWLQRVLQTRIPRLPPSQRLVFVNAWNEWAEGAVLEPDARLGYAWLDATRQALQSAAVIKRSRDAPAQRPCAVVHVWHVELLDEIAAALRAGGLDWRLLITTAPERAEAITARLRALRLPAELVVRENRGRDILPFLHAAERLLDEGVQVVLKLHTKRSSHRSDGDAWRRDLIERLLRPERVAAITRAFAEDPTLGLAAAEGHLQPLGTYWGANRDAVDYLALRMGFPPPTPERARFAAGSMFWLRPEALRPLLDAHLDDWDFEREKGQLDGTFAHAVERVFCHVVEHAGFRVTTAAAMCGEAETDPDACYPHAQPG